jgi:hypothetical protein
LLRLLLLMRLVDNCVDKTQAIPVPQPPDGERVYRVTGSLAESAEPEAAA